MRVYLASPRGFCAGVEMAIDCLDQALELFGSPLFSFHEIVHNEIIVESFKRRGVTFVNSVSDVPEGALLIYSAHGISPDIRAEAKARKLRTIDATCPLVAKVHTEALYFASRGYHILYVGHAGHDEVVGTMGEVPEAMTLVESVRDVENLQFPKDARLACLTQTTLSIDDCRKIIEAIQKKYPGVVAPKKEDICYATQNRQDAVKILGVKVDLVIVVGSQNSSNSKRLLEVAKQLGKPAILINNPNEITDQWMAEVRSVLLTSGASAPEPVVKDCVRLFKEKYGAEVIEETVREEHVSFGLPKELRAMMGGKHEDGSTCFIARGKCGSSL